ncbi:hypothetical protein M2390_000731 [Mycetocola sp. BIGb0189]|nr:hypothetical protein [Mycetocola sp. BIGb0189]
MHAPHFFDAERTAMLATERPAMFATEREIERAAA